MILKRFRTKSRALEFQEMVASLVFFYLLPILLLAYGALPLGANHVVLVIMSLVMVAYAISKPIPGRELGFRPDNLRSALLWQGFVSLILMGALLLVSRAGIMHPKYYGESVIFYLFYVLISAPLQEFVFRSLMFRELNIYLNRDWIKVLLSAVIFSFAHYAYRDLSVLLMTFVAGLLWGFVYLKRPNFWAVAASHAVVGTVTIFLGFV